MRDANVITSMHAVCALGEGVQTIVGNMLAGQSGLVRCDQFKTLEHQPPVFAGKIADDIWHQAICANPSADRAAALGIMVAQKVLDEATPASLLRTGLIVSTTKAQIDTLFHAVRMDASQPPKEVGQPVQMLQQMIDAIGVGGPTLVVSNACASGLVAMMQADRWLRRGWADRVLVVGVDLLSEFVATGFQALMALGSGSCRPFDEKRDGISLGEAAAAVMLEPADTQSPNLATLEGYAHTSDGFHLTAPARGGVHLASAIKATLQMAKIEADSVDWINAHGTGTPYNDEAEACAIADAIGCNTPVSSMKAYVGHTLGAAGILEAVISVACMRQGIAPASLNCDKLGVPVNIRVLQSPLKTSMRYVLTLKTGFGGLNAAMLLGRPTF